VFESIINFSVQKAKDILRPVSAQLVFVFMAFAVMIITSYSFVSDIERKHLINDTENAIAYTQAHINADLLEPETTLGTIAETVRIMIINGSTFDAVTNYISHIADYMVADDHLVTYATSVYGVFDVFGDKLWTSLEWTPPDDFVPAERPWYKAAVEANGGVGVTEPYLDALLGIISVTYARRIFDDNGRPLAIICLDISLDRIRSYADNTRVIKGSYGILLNKQLDVIAHPIPAYLGKALRDLNDGVAIENDLKNGMEISERRVVDYKGDASILFIRQLKNGWYLGIITPEDTYYQSMKNIASLLTVLGFLMAVTLGAGLIRIAAEKK